MLTSLGTIPTLLLLLTTLTPSVTASATLKSEVYQLPDYPYLTTCQKRCTAGEPSNQADLISIFYLSNCDTKACFCPAQNEPQIGQQAQRCLETEGSGACATVKEYNGLMAFVGKYCGFNYAPATTGLLFPPSGGAATTTPGVTASCWNKYGYPVQTAGCSSTMTTATRTSNPYLTATTSTGSAQASDLPVTKGKKGFNIGKIIGLSVLGLFVSSILGALGCNFICPWFCCCC